MSSSHQLLSQLAEEGDLWDTSLAFVWPPQSPMSTTSNSSEEDLLPAWLGSDLQPSQSTSDWGFINEDTVLFGDFYSSLGVQQELDDEGGVIVASCLNSSGSNSRLQEEEEDEDEDHFGGDDGEEQQVHFFPTTTASSDVAAMEKKKGPVAGSKWPAVKEEEVVVVEKVKAEKKEQEAPFPHLMVKLETVQDNNNNCSVVSTPDVVNDVIDMLEEEKLFQRNLENNYIEIDETETSDGVDFVFDEDDCDEYTVEYVDASVLGLSDDVFATSTNPPSVATPSIELGESNANTEFEDDEKDEDYKPPEEGRRMRRSTRSMSSTSSSNGVKKRGRPAKPLRTHLTAREVAHLRPEEKRDVEMRFKNNEASRLSRFKRRQKDLKLNDQCAWYEDENKDLRRVLKAHKRLHKRFYALMVGLKMPK